MIPALGGHCHLAREVATRRRRDDLSAMLRTLATIVVLAGATAAQAARPAALTPGAVVQRTLAPGASERFRLELRRGEFVRLELLPDNVVLEARLTAPGGAAIASAGDPNRDDEPICLALIAPADGAYRLEVVMG